MRYSGDSIKSRITFAASLHRPSCAPALAGSVPSSGLKRTHAIGLSVLVISFFTRFVEAQ